MVHDFNKAVIRKLNFENLAILNFSSLCCVSEEVSDVTLSKKNWIIIVTASQKQAMSATQLKVIVFKPWKSCIIMPMVVLIG